MWAQDPILNRSQTPNSEIDPITRMSTSMPILIDKESVCVINPKRLAY